MDIITNITPLSDEELSYEVTRKIQVIDIDDTVLKEKPEKGYNNKKNKFKISNRDLLQLLSLLLILFVVFKFLIISVRVDGISMEPTFSNGDRGVMLKTTPINKPKRNDVIVFDGTRAYNSEKYIVKRIIAVANDTVEIKNNIIYVNGKAIDDEHRSKDTMMEDYSKIIVSEKALFVLGDNRNNSLDSRKVGLIKEDEVVAVNGIIFWPFNNFGLMN